MRLADDDALARLTDHDHGVLATAHPDRGADAVPCVYAVVDGHVGIPVDTVKPKASTRLRREANLDADPRATLLAEHWDADDWSRLWWVRAQLHREPDASAERQAALTAALVARFPPYRDAAEPFARVLVFRIVGLTGWAAAAD